MIKSLASHLNRAGCAGWWFIWLHHQHAWDDTQGESVKACGATFEPRAFHRMKKMQDAFNAPWIKYSLLFGCSLLEKKQPLRNKKAGNAKYFITCQPQGVLLAVEFTRRVAVMTSRLYASSDAIYSRRYCEGAQKRHLVQLQPPG